MQVPGLLCEDADLSSRVRYPPPAVFPVPARTRMAANRRGILHFRSGLSGEGGTRNALRISALPNPKPESGAIRATLPSNLLILRDF